MSLFNRIRTPLLICALLVVTLWGVHTLSAQSSGYTPVSVNSPLNTSLKVTATPLELNNTTNMWSYKIDWKRTRNAQGSLSIAEESSPTTKILTLSPVSQEGSQTVTLKPSTTYRVKFYSTPGYGGTLILSKKMTTLSVSDENPDLEDDISTGDTSASGLQAQIAALLAQINELRARLSGGTTAGTNTGTTPTVNAVGTGTLTGSYNPNVDTPLTDKFYIAPASQMKDTGMPAFFVVRAGASNAIEGQSWGANRYFLAIEGLPSGLEVYTYPTTPGMGGSGPNEPKGNDWYIKNNGDWFDWSWTNPTYKLFGTETVLYNRILPPLPNLTAKTVKGGVGTVAHNEIELKPGAVIIIGIQNTPRFRGSGVYTLKGVLKQVSMGFGSTGYLTERKISRLKEVTFSVDMGNPAQLCLSEVQTKSYFKTPVAKAADTYQPTVTNSDAILKSFTESCDPSLAQYGAAGLEPKQFFSNDPNYSTLMSKAEDCARKAQSQASRLGIAMTCSVKQFGITYAPACNTINSGMPLVDWMAVNLVGTGYTNMNLYDAKGWQGVITTDITGGMAKKFGTNIDPSGYWDIDAGAYRKLDKSTSAIAPQVCANVLKVEGLTRDYISPDLYGGIRLGQPVNAGKGYSGAITGDKVTLVLQAPSTVRSASIYLMMDYSATLTPEDTSIADTMGNMNSSVEDYNGVLQTIQEGPADQDQKASRGGSAVPHISPFSPGIIPPGVVSKIGTVSFDANGVATYEWTVPNPGPVLIRDTKNILAYGTNQGQPLSPLWYKIRVVADNGIWNDSKRFYIDPKNLAEKSKTLITNCDPQSNQTCGTTVNNRPADMNNGMSIATPAGTYVSRTIGANGTGPMIVVLSSDNLFSGDGQETYVREWNWTKLTKSQQTTFKPGDTATVYAWTSNLYTQKVDLELVKYAPNCPKDYSQSPDGTNLTCLRNYANSTDHSVVMKLASAVVPTKDAQNFGLDWRLKYVFTIPSTLESGTYQIRMTDPDYLYGFAAQQQGSTPSGAGVQFSQTFTVSR